jgi:hypothetical protein
MKTNNSSQQDIHILSGARRAHFEGFLSLNNLTSIPEQKTPDRANYFVQMRV